MTNCTCGVCSELGGLVPVRPAVVTLERSETTIVRGLSARDPVRRAALEEALLEAYAAGDVPRVSRLRGELVAGA